MDTTYKITGTETRCLRASVDVIASAIAGAPIRIGSQDQPRPTFRTEANYVRVDAYATTKDGVPIEDLRRDEFELLEDRVPQTIDQFAVHIRGGGAPTARSDPRTPEESRQAATDARARVFILFLDVMHVDRTASIRVAKALIGSPYTRFVFHRPRRNRSPLTTATVENATVMAM